MTGFFLEKKKQKPNEENQIIQDVNEYEKLKDENGETDPQKDSEE